MITNKIKLIFFIVALAIVALGVSSFLALKSIEDAKIENENAKFKIEELNNSLNALQSALENTNDEISDHEERIKKYQEIISAWSKATPDVNNAVKKIMSAYEDVAKNSRLFPKDKIKGLEDNMMNAVYSVIRSTDPQSLADNFVKTITQLNESRYDNIIKSKITQIKKDGVTFPEDTKAINELRAYYNSFLENSAVIESFKVMGLDKEIASLEAQLDADEENDLAKAFEKTVSEIKTPITLATVLDTANTAWKTLYNALEKDDKLAENTAKARALLDTYTVRINQLKLAKEKANAINSKISALKIYADIATKNMISSLEAEISAWIKEFQIDDANMSLVNDLTPLKKAYEKAIADLRTLYEAYKRAVEGIGKVNVGSKPLIDAALNAYEAIKEFKDTNALLSLEKENTVEALFDTLQRALYSYNYRVELIDSIRTEIDRIHSADPDVSHEDIAKLNLKVEELLAIETSINVINEGKTNYVALLEEARLLPYKNEAFVVVKTTYDTYYEQANNDRTLILALVEIKDNSLKAIENAKSTDEIKELIEKAKSDFQNCFK